jgi:hypothetical protein
MYVNFFPQYNLKKLQALNNFFSVTNNFIIFENVIEFLGVSNPGLMCEFILFTEPRISENPSGIAVTLIVGATPAPSAAAATAEPTVAMEQAHAKDSMPSVVNYDASIGLIGEVVSYGSKTQQNIACACVQNKDENCSICFRDPEEIHEQPAATGPEIVENSAIANKSSAFVCGFCSQTVSYAKRNHFDPQCYPCNQSFRCQGLLQRHMQKETVYCKNCKKKLHGSNAIIMHENTNQCSVCDKSFNCQTRLNVHLGKSPGCKNFLPSSRGNNLHDDDEEEEPTTPRGSTNKTFRCWHCSAKLKTYREKTAHQEEQWCPCGMKFRCRVQFTSHKDKCQAVTPTPAPPTIKCKYCSTKCKSARELQVHLRKKIKCDACHSNFSCASFPGHKCEIQCVHCGETVAAGHSASHFEGDFECKGCGQKSACSAMLQRHEGTCKKDKPQEQEISTSSSMVQDSRCRYCQVGCASPAELQTHMLVSNCPRCGFLQPCLALLDAHLRDCRFVALVGQHRCPMCTKTFQSAAFLGTHVVVEHAAGAPDQQKNHQLSAAQQPPPVQVKQERRELTEVIVLD